tara:strand:- start:7052 stop:8536 length:1485 start_codon:yes stop_codon:yes gene_type:complete
MAITKINSFGDAVNFFKAKFQPKSKAKGRVRNSYDGARVDRFTNDWITSDSNADTMLERDLVKLRSRCRDLVRNDGYSQSALRQTITNVVGEGGYRVKINAKNKRGGQDAAASKAVLEAWRDFCRPENYTVTKNVSEQEFDCLMMKSTFTSGGGLARIARGYGGNDYRYALQGIPIERLDPEFYDDRAGVSMSVQRDGYDQDTFYHVLKTHPGHRVHFGQAKSAREVIPASEVIHAFIQNEFGQSQGEPWLSPVVQRLRQLGSYEQAELIAARAHASKLGFFEESHESGGYEGEGEDSYGNISMDGSPGSFEKLPPGVTANLIDPSHPNADYPAFRKAILRGVAAGIVSNYNLLAEDLEGVSYSSIRQGTLAERDAWKMIQRWYIDTVKKPIFSDWLEWVLMSGKIAGYGLRDFDRLNHPEFQGRRWSWVDPLKDGKADELRLSLGLTSAQRLARNAGEDLGEIHDEIKEDGQLDFFKKLEAAKEPPPTKPAGK